MDFYDVSTAPSILLGSYSGNTLPDPLICYTNRVKVVFVSDNFLNAEGFRVLWDASGTGIVEEQAGVKVYPNPASDLIHVDFDDPKESCEVVLYDMVGNVQYRQTLSMGNRVEIPVKQLTNGLYIMSLCDGEHTTYRKIMVKH